MAANGFPVVPGSAVWTDYDGDVPYDDFMWNAATEQTVTTQIYLPGIGQASVVTPPAIGPLLYTHADQVGSTRLMTDPGGEIVGRFIYTAFGELVYEDGGSIGTTAVKTRYKWGGAWQYETGLGSDASGNDPLPYTRIGHRWYDPSTGRFLQRDPIGIEGGLNTYVYCDNLPTLLFDPYGLDWWNPLDYEPVARATLWVTGGSTCAGRFIDKVGGQIEKDRSAGRIAGRYLLSGATGSSMKKLAIPGQKLRTLNWTKVTGNLKWGRRLAKGSGAATILEGTIAIGDIGRGLIAWWYDVELD